MRFRHSLGTVIVTSHDRWLRRHWTARRWWSSARRQPLRALTCSVALGSTRVQVADDAEVDELEDRRLVVLVDRDDRLRRLHAGPVLDRAGDAGGDIQLRRDGLAGLADLVGVRVPARVDRRTRGTDGRTEGVGERLDRLEVAAGPAPTGHHDRGLGQLGTTGRLTRLAFDDRRGLGRVARPHRTALRRRRRRPPPA